MHAEDVENRPLFGRMNDATFRQSADPSLWHAIRAANRRLETGTNSARQAGVCPPSSAPAPPRSRQAIGIDIDSDLRGTARERPCVGHERWQCVRSQRRRVGLQRSRCENSRFHHRTTMRGHICPFLAHSASMHRDRARRWLASTKRTRPASCEVLARRLGSARRRTITTNNRDRSAAGSGRSGGARGLCARRTARRPGDQRTTAKTTLGSCVVPGARRRPGPVVWWEAAESTQPAGAPGHCIGFRRQPGRLALAVFRTPLLLLSAWLRLAPSRRFLLVRAGRRTASPTPPLITGSYLRPCA